MTLSRNAKIAIYGIPVVVGIYLIYKQFSKVKCSNLMQKMDFIYWQFSKVKCSNLMQKMDFDLFAVFQSEML